MVLQKLVVSCGGTGGHFFPGLSVARVFEKQGGEVLLLLSGDHAAEQKDIAEKFGINAVALPQMPHYKKHPLRFIKGFAGGYFAACREMKNFRAQAMLGMGSFATLPVVMAALRNKVPLFVHDGNARIGKANRMFSRWARFAASAFPAVNAKNCRCPVFETGMPLRSEIVHCAKLDKKTATAELNREFGTDFSSDIPLILVTGGSQGAAVFNTVLPEAFKLSDRKFQVIHLTGKNKIAETEERYVGTGFRKMLVESTGKMAELLSAADIVFSRSGGSTAAELALFGKASVLVPYPYAAEGHQADNAGYFASVGAAVMVKNSDFTVERASELINDFIENREKWDDMGKKMRELARPEAAEELIERISAELD